MSEREILPCAEATFCNDDCRCATGLKLFGYWIDAHFYCDTERLAEAINEAYVEWNAAPRPQTCEPDAVAETCKEGHDHTGYIDGCRVPSEGEPPAVILCPNCGMAHYSGPCSGAKEVDYDEEGEEAGP